MSAKYVARVRHAFSKDLGKRTLKSLPPGANLVFFTKPQHSRAASLGIL
jgi:hypothetical protein